MKKINRACIKGTNWALAGLIALLGISSCSDDFEPEKKKDIINNGNGGNGEDDDDDIVCEYGTPYATFVVSGKVTDTDGKGLEGIRIVVPGVDHHQKATAGFIPGSPVITEMPRDTFYTETNGTFNYPYNGFPTNDSINIRLKFEDVSDNPQFETDSTKVTFFSSELKNGDNKWYSGRTEKEMQIALKNKKNEEEKTAE